MLSASGTFAVPVKILKRSSCTKRYSAPCQHTRPTKIKSGHLVCTRKRCGEQGARDYNAPLTMRAYLSREIVSQTKVWSSGNPTAARRANAGLGKTPNTAEPLPASEASAAPARSKALLIAFNRGCRLKTACSKSFDRPLPCVLQHRAQNSQSLWVAADFVNC